MKPAEKAIRTFTLGTNLDIIRGVHWEYERKGGYKMEVNLIKTAHPEACTCGENKGTRYTSAGYWLIFKGEGCLDGEHYNHKPFSGPYKLTIDRACKPALLI